MFNLMDSGEIKFSWLLYIQFIPNIFSLMNNNLNK